MTIDENGRPAQGTRGFLMRDVTTGEFFFRVYESPSAGAFRDFTVLADVEIEILDENVSLYGAGVLDYTDV